MHLWGVAHQLQELGQRPQDYNGFVYAQQLAASTLILFHMLVCYVYKRKERIQRVGLRRFGFPQTWFQRADHVRTSPALRQQTWDPHHRRLAAAAKLRPCQKWINSTTEKPSVAYGLRRSQGHTSHARRFRRYRHVNRSTINIHEAWCKWDLNFKSSIID